MTPPSLYDEPWYPFTAREERLMAPHELWANPFWAIPRFSIVTEKAKVVPLWTVGIHPEQIQIIQTLIAHDQTAILKPRQIGCTTIIVAFIFWMLHRAPDPVRALTITHESGAVGRVNSMVEEFWKNLPDALRPGVPKPWNAKEFGLPHNGAVASQIMAGGRGQARSWTNQILHGTEMAFWPRGSAVLAGSDVDRTAWASAQSTQHEGPYKWTVVESTGNGPSGIYYDVFRNALTDPNWGTLFFAWSQFEKYRREVPEGWRPTEDEEALAEDFGLDDEQLCWRRYKLRSQGYTLEQFMKEYPLTWHDPFMTARGMWFDGINLNRIIASIDLNTSPKAGRDGVIVYHLVEEGRKYFAGLDTSGGTGGDFATMVVLREDLEVVALWRSNAIKPHLQADLAVKVSNYYNRARILCEKNNYGEAVITAMAKMNAYLWKSAEGKDFWTQGGPTSKTKKMIYDHAAKMVDGNFVGINDPGLAQQLTTIREQENGNIEADGGGHDDDADALALALWNARRQYTVRERKPMAHAKVMAQRLREMGFRRPVGVQ